MQTTETLIFNPNPENPFAVSSFDNFQPGKVYAVWVGYYRMFVGNSCEYCFHYADRTEARIHAYHLRKLGYDCGIRLEYWTA